MISNKLFKLAKLIKCINELNTNNGVLISDVEFEVGVEVFIQDAETGDLVPAPAGQYETDTQIITVNEQGIIDKIEEKESAPIENPEETPAPEEEEKPAEEEEKPVEQAEETEEQPAEEEDKDAKIAELQGLLDAANAKIAELEAIITDYKEKEQETPETIEEEDRKQHEQKYATMTRSERMLNALKNRK